MFQATTPKRKVRNDGPQASEGVKNEKFRGTLSKQGIHAEVPKRNITNESFQMNNFTKDFPSKLTQATDPKSQVPTNILNTLVMVNRKHTNRETKWTNEFQRSAATWC